MSSTAVTVPRNTTSLACRPGHCPGDSCEQVHARTAAGTARIKSTRIRIAREITADILHAFRRDAKSQSSHRFSTLLHSLGYTRSPALTLLDGENFAVPEAMSSRLRP